MRPLRVSLVCCIASWILIAGPEPRRIQVAASLTGMQSWRNSEHTKRESANYFDPLFLLLRSRHGDSHEHYSGASEYRSYFLTRLRQSCRAWGVLMLTSRIAIKHRQFIASFFCLIEAPP